MGEGINRSLFDRVSQPFLLDPPESVQTDLERHRDPMSAQYDENILPSQPRIRHLGKGWIVDGEW